jgi:TonB family protein
MPEGKGTEAGSEETACIQAHLKKNWSLSKYQVVRQDLEANVLLTYDAQGNLIDYKFQQKSGDLTFDESVKKAILKAKELPFEPDRRLMIDVVFNLKDLLE